MAIESQADFNSYLNTNGHGVSAIFFEVQNDLWDSRYGLIDTWYDLDSGDARNINIILDQEYTSIPGQSLDVAGYQPVAYVKYTDAPYASHLDRIRVDAITTNKGNVITPQTFYTITHVENDNVGMLKLFLMEE
jgi:hypothetical protein